MKITVIYHSADYDGIFCREIAKKFLGEGDVEYIGWNFGDPLIPVPKNLCYILDLSPDCLTGGAFLNNQVIWIDHHKTSIDKWPLDIKGYRIDGVAACRLTYQWFTNENDLPKKEDYVNRVVNEPWSVRLAGEYDIWDKRDPDAETFQYALRSCDTNPPWESIFSQEETIQNMLIGGRICQKYAQNTDASICNSRTWLMSWEGLNFLCVNSARFNSLLFAAKDIPETGHEALLGFCFDGRQWTCSLYHAKHRKDLDLSEIAKKHGGGGHRGACGFTCKYLPFSL